MKILKSHGIQPTHGNLRDHGTNGAHAMPSVAPELDHVIANVFAALLVVQVVTRICPKRKNAKVMMI